MANERILILEDELLIADDISDFLSDRNYQVIGIAISFEEAQQLYQTKAPDLALVDIRLSGPKTGIDFAHYLRQQSTLIPFIYLTSQSDQKNLAAAKETLPAGYLAKPINKESLFASIEMAMYRSQLDQIPANQVTLFDGHKHHRVQYADITFLATEHVYVRVHLRNCF